MSRSYEKPNISYTMETIVPDHMTNGAKSEAAAHSRFGCACLAPEKGRKLDPKHAILTPGRWKKLEPVAYKVRADQFKKEVFHGVVPGTLIAVDTDETDKTKVTRKPVRVQREYWAYCSCQVEPVGTKASTKPSEPAHMTEDTPEIPEVKLSRKEQRALAAETKKRHAEQDADLAKALADMKAEEAAPAPPTVADFATELDALVESQKSALDALKARYSNILR